MKALLLTELLGIGKYAYRYILNAAIREILRTAFEKVPIDQQRVKRVRIPS